MAGKHSGIDFGDYCRLVESALTIQRRYQLFLWSRGELQTFLPHRTVLCAVGDLSRMNYRLECLSESPNENSRAAEFGNRANGLLPRLLAAWRRNGHAPLVISRAGDCEALDGELEHHGLQDCSAHGLVDPEHGIGALFVFLDGLCEPRGTRAHRLALLVPQLMAAVQRIDRAERFVSLALAEESMLSAREAEIMHWIRAGKTNQEIGQILDISPYTVKNHVQKILRKLNVTNRAEAAGKSRRPEYRPAGEGGDVIRIGAGK